MNETKLTLRQNFILNLINQSNGLSRGEIQEKIKKVYQISKPTLARDLVKIKESQLLRIEGKGKKTRYFSFSKNPLLKPFDLDIYFSLEPDKRANVKKNFDFGVFEHLNELFFEPEIKEISQVHKSFSKQTEKLSPDILKRELERFVIELSWKSSKIEGNTYTLLETETLIRKNKEAEGRTKEEAIMILNHKRAFEQIMKDKASFKKVSLSIVNQLHNTLTTGLGIGSGIREHGVGITGTAYRPLDNQHQIREAMEKLTKVINKRRSPLEKALIANAMISYIQPYSDGNKRTGRMLTNAFLLTHDYYPLSYRSIDEEEFKKALILFYEQGSLYHLKRLFLEQLIFVYHNYFK